MRREEIQNYVVDNQLLNNVFCKPGIYAITIENRIAYIGQSKNLYQRCCQHIYNTQNAVFNNEKKYLLLLSAQLGGFKVDCSPLEYCSIDELNEKENYYINKYKPCLNILTPTGKQNIDNLTIVDVLKSLEYEVIFDEE